MATKARLRANAKYDKENTTQVALKLNRKTDKDVLEWLGRKPNKQGYIKDLIRADMKNQPKE